LSAAAALDGAISKNAVWVCECFGTDAEGKSLLRRLLTRGNPERKRQGPVTITLGGSTLKGSRIEVAITGTGVVKGRDLTTLSKNLQGRWNQQHPTRGGTPVNRTVSIDGALPPPNTPPDTRELAPIFYESVLSCLRETDVFTPKKIQERYQHLASNIEFQRLSGGMERLATAIDREQSSSSRLGIVNPENDFRTVWGSDRAPLRILMPGSHVAAVALMEHMALDEGYPFLLDYRYSHANEIVQVLLSGEEIEGIDACIVSLGQLGRLLATRRKLSFEPLMILPAVKLELLTPRGAPRSSKLDGSRIHLLHEGGSSSAIFLHEAIDATESSRAKVTFEHAEPLTFAQHLQTPDANTHVVAWFPYSVMLQYRTGCRVRSFGEASYKENFLLVNRRVLQQRGVAESLDISIRNSWLSMIEEPQRVLSTVTRLLGTKLYRQALRRWVGWDRVTSAPTTAPG
jgi:hypothetical protein